MKRKDAAKDFDLQWHKILALVMFKLGIDEVEIEAPMIEEYVNKWGRGAVVVVDTRGGDVMRLRLATAEGAAKIQREAKAN